MKKIVSALCMLFSLTAAAQNVGIGETNPAESKLQVKNTDSSVLLIQNTATPNGTKTGLFYKSDGNYSGGIATVKTAAVTYRMGLYTFGGATATSLKERISILDNGNVGIGTTTPVAKLEVAGSVKITDGTQGADKILTSDAAGNATWQEKTVNGSVGFGTWGDCSTNGISEYNPVVDPDANDFDYLGKSVAISGNWAIVGAPTDVVGANTHQGSVCFYEFNGTNWVFKQKINEATGAADDEFGLRVSISGNYAFVGIPYDDIGANTDQGSVNVYFYNGTNWVFAQKLTDSNGQAADFFGGDVCVNGSVAIIGAYADDGSFTAQGSVSFYQLLIGSWIFKQKTVDNTPEASNYFGQSISISGNYAIVGVPYDDIGANNNAGSVSFFYYNGTNWVFIQKITGSAVSGAEFGSSVSLSGLFAIVGAPKENVGGFTRGSVQFFRYNGSSWVSMLKIISPVNGTNFGTSVDIDGDYAIVGDVQDGQNPGNQEGTSTIYQRLGLGWQKLQKFETPNNAFYYRTGDAIGIDGTTKRFVVGVPGYANNSGKAVFGKVN